MATRAAGFLIFRRVDEGIQYLLLKASYGDEHWTPPKGHVDPGEDDWTTALRETREEAGLAESQLRVYRDVTETLRYRVGGRDKCVVYWLARLVDPHAPVTLSDEHTHFRWTGLDEAKRLATYEDFNRMLDEFHRKASLLVADDS